MMYRIQKVTTLLLIFCLSAPLVMAQIQFAKGNWDEVRQKAKKENKHIMVDAYTTWCGPCKWMSANVFTDPEVGKFYNQNYVSYKLDMEKGEGPTFATDYGIMAYPTIVYFNPEGEMVHKTVGAAEGEAFIEYGTDALNPEKQLYTLQKRYEEGNNDPEFIKSYIMALQAAYEEEMIPHLAKKYLDSQNKEQWINEENWEFIQQFSEGTSSETFKYVMEHQADFREKYGDYPVDDFINRMMGDEMMGVIDSQDEQILAEYKNKLKEAMPEQADEMIARLEYAFYGQDDEKSFRYAKIYFDKYANDWSELNEAAWDYFGNVEDKAKLNAALYWAERSIEIDKNWYNTDTKANLLFKLGKYKEALPIAKESIQIGKDMGENTAETEDLLKKIQEKVKK